MPEPQEIEGKFSCSEDDINRILTLTQIGDFYLTHHSERTQTDLYYDTRNLLLRERSCSLRMRSVGNSHLATFKGPRQAVETAEEASHLVTRLEIEVEVKPPLDATTSFVDRLDLEPVLRAHELIGQGRQLSPIARLVTHRRMFHFERESDEIVELALDDVQAVDLRHDRRTHIIEVELELKAGRAETLVSAADGLRQAIPTLRPSVDSKLARTLRQTSLPVDRVG
jgi:inorganic triphosphatase YgiF